MAIFVTVVFTVYFLANLYIYLKGHRALTGAGLPVALYTAVFVILASAFIAGKVLEYRHSSVFTDILNIIGGFWMAFMLYGFLIWLTADILLLLQKPFHLVPVASLPKLRLWLFITVTSVTVLLIIMGFINAITPVTKRYDLDIDKSFSDGRDSIRVVAVSDIHLGSIIRKRSMRQLSHMINEEKPDVVLFLGDLLDGSIGPVLRDDLLSYLSLDESPYGKFAITGNHEYMSDLGKALPYIEGKGIRVLMDEVVTLGNGLQLAGRKDRSAIRLPGDDGRMSLDKLLSQCDTTAPLIVMDHQPFELSSLAETAVDIQLSGHTHNGQIWPLTIITNRMFELSYGMKRFGKATVIVSSGFGIWGPRMRIGTRPEILSICLHGRSE
jgi:predicted MPP superfamily phosphohydrolase